MLQTHINILSADVISNKAKVEAKSSNIIKFNVVLPDYIRPMMVGLIYTDLLNSIIIFYPSC